MFGLRWNQVSDVIFCQELTTLCHVMSLQDVKFYTMYVSQIFDPMRLLVPITFLEKCWNRNYGPSINHGINHCQGILRKVASHSKYIYTVFPDKIPRFIRASCKTAVYQLLVFCASTRAYAAFIYLRIEEETEIKIHLIFSKMRLVPVKRRKIRS